MRLWKLIALVIILTPIASTARCLAYEPSSVSLEGKLASVTLPGPPNYASIARGDAPEVVLTLHLTDAICVKGDPNSTLNSDTRSGVTEVQLSVPLDRARALVGKRVRATGTLFGAHTGHHRKPVLMRVSVLRAA